MKVGTSRVQLESPEYLERFEAMSKLVAQLEDEKRKCLFQGEQKYLERSQRGGKLLARERYHESRTSCKIMHSTEDGESSLVQF
jgi:hypothetical protein